MTKRVPPAAAWKPGQSGNPKGRPPGSGEVARLRAGIAAHVPEIITKLVALAKAGDVGAARLLLERAVPPVKPSEPVAAVELPPSGTLADQGRALLEAAGRGQLGPGQAAQLIGALGVIARLVETDELVDRVAALEEKSRGTPP